MSKFLVTGAAGFIGSNLAAALLKRGDQVRGIDDLSTGRRENLAPLLGAMEFIEADICDPAAIATACAGVDYVFHEAAIPSVPMSVGDPVRCNRAAVDGTLSVLIAARDAGVKRVIYAASSAAYGDTPALPKHEDMLVDPISPYAVAKLAAEMYMKSFYRCYGLETVCLRYFNVFGPKQDPSSPYSGVLSRFITLMLRGEQPVIFGDGSQSRDFVYIGDVVQANLLACAAPAQSCAGRVVNIACGRSVNLNQVYTLLQSITGYVKPPQYGPEREGDIRHSVADIDAARAAIGYEPKVEFEEGLRNTVQWYRAGSGNWEDRTRGPFTAEYAEDAEVTEEDNSGLK